MGGSVDNNIGDASCEALATLLTDPNCNLHALDLGHNNITNEGATTIANSLVNNTKLRVLCLYYNQIDPSVDDVFSKILCNNTSINLTYSSNHNLETFPSVSVVNENEILMYGDTTYIDDNNLKITFSAGFSGKAYLN